MNAVRIGFTEEELRYILDPKDVYGEDFPSETFRVLKDKETRLYGANTAPNASSSKRGNNCRR